MRLKSQILLGQIRDAASRVAQFVRDKTAEDLGRDQYFRGAVYFQFVLIGEAVKELAQDDLQTAEQLSEYWRIIGFRNQIVHAYEKIDDGITWRIILEKIPVLQAEIAALLKE